MELIQYINSKIKLSAEESSTIDAAFRREFYPKGTILADPGNRSQKVHFIEKGMLRQNIQYLKIVMWNITG